MLNKLQKHVILELRFQSMGQNSAILGSHQLGAQSQDVAVDLNHDHTRFVLGMRCK